MKLPPNHHTTSTVEKLNPSGPADMPDRERHGNVPKHHTTSTTVELGATEHPVANLGNRPGQGPYHSIASVTNLSRTATNPYDKLNATKPQVSFTGKKTKPNGTGY